MNLEQARDQLAAAIVAAAKNTELPVTVTEQVLKRYVPSGHRARPDLWTRVGKHFKTALNDALSQHDLYAAFDREARTFTIGVY